MTAEKKEVIMKWEQMNNKQKQIKPSNKSASEGPNLSIKIAELIATTSINVVVIVVVNNVEIINIIATIN